MSTGRNVPNVASPNAVSESRSQRVAIDARERSSSVAAKTRRGPLALTWPLVTVFGFIAQPKQHMFMKPNTMRAAARLYDFELSYRSRPNWQTYSNLLELPGGCVATSANSVHAT